MTAPAGSVATPPAYVARATCDQQLPPLASVDDPNCFLPVGTQVQCPTCGRTWNVVESVTWCSPVQVEWQCTTPPPENWTPPTTQEAK